MMNAVEDITIDRRLLALPYRLEVTPEGWIVMTPLEEPGLTWEQLATTHPILPEDSHWKVETNALNQIIMSPPPYLDHAGYAGEIIIVLSRLLPEGRPMPEAGVKTSDGTKIPDVVWVSKARWKTRRRKPSFILAPEICVEIISPSNTKREIDEKKRLYFEAGALEVWRCEREGAMKFFAPSGQLKQSQLCPDFPDRLDPFA